MKKIVKKLVGDRWRDADGKPVIIDFDSCTLDHSVGIIDHYKGNNGK